MGFFSDLGKQLFPQGWKSFLPDLNFRDFSHANKMFASGDFALAPKFGFLYYVDIQLNPKILPGSFGGAEKIKLNMLVKRATLPGYDYNLEEKNAYNRRTYTYKRFKYLPIDIDFHDDSSDIVNAFWASYYNYTIQDGSLGQQKFVNDKYDEKRRSLVYGIDNSKYAQKKDNPISSITIYVLSRRRFVGFKLVNPKIDSFKHSEVTSEGSSIMSASMRIVYETVEYSKGSVAKDSPKGFATLNYDNEPSPLRLPGAGIKGILGKGGLLDVGASIFDDIRGGNFGLGTILKGASIIKSVKKGGLKATLKEEAAGLVTGAITGVITGRNPLEFAQQRFGPYFAPSSNNTVSRLTGTSAQGSVPSQNIIDNSTRSVSQVQTTSSNILTGNGGP